MLPPRVLENIWAHIGQIATDWVGLGHYSANP